MLLRYFYDEKLAHASYLVGCQATGEAIVIDPARDVEQYIEVAAANGLRIVAATETHIHADYVSGVRELAERVGARLYLSDEGDENWKYRYAPQYDHRLLKDGDVFMIGNIRFQVLHTPGHTPESISLMITDTAGADQPMGVFTGDFLFVGDVGRPDLLEEAAGIKGTKEVGARQLFRSLQTFRELPDHLQIWPAHGAGSACGKALGAVPSSTLGYEKLFNWAFQITGEEEFVQAVLEGQPDPPKYFAVMKRVNKEGPAVLNGLPRVPELDAGRLVQLLEQNAWVVDTRSMEEFAAKHIPGTVGIPLNRSFNTYAGWVLPYDQPLYLIVEPGRLEEAVRDLIHVGLDTIGGFFTPEVIQLWPTLTGQKPASLKLATPEAIAPQVLSGEVNVLDVRNAYEVQEGRIPGAHHIALTRLVEHLEAVPNGRPLVVNCRTGGRSFVAATLLQRHGIPQVINLDGGFLAWKEAGLPVKE
ncbi:MAG: MBL fold metallo-hydrolase [Calditrichaeota bacterium]|nr:MAG: MBL fold metallo-hydrolase [Calditrichota bacterium]